MRDPLNQFERGFAWSVGRRAAYRMPLGVGILIVVLMSLLSHCN